MKNNVYCLYISIFSIINLILKYRVHISWKKEKNDCGNKNYILPECFGVGKSPPSPLFLNRFFILSLLYYAKVLTYSGPLFSEHAPG